MSACRPRSWLTSGWSLRKSTGSFSVSSSFNRWARARSSSRNQSFQPLSPVSPLLLMCMACRSCGKPQHRTGTFGWGSARQLRVKSVSGSRFSQTYGHMGKRTTCYLTALLDFASVYFQPSVVAPREFCTVHIFPQYGAKIIHFTLQRSWLYIL